MYIDGDTHYWPVRFIDKVDHPGRGHLEFQKGTGAVSRFGVDFPGDAATYFRDGKKIHSFSETRWNLDMHHDVMLREGFDYQVVIADNRPLIYEVERDLGVAQARAYNDNTFPGRCRSVPDRSKASRPISRVLSWTAIHLGCALPRTSSGLPGSGADSAIGPLFGLAPGGVYLAAAVTSRRGALLPHRFTLTPAAEAAGAVYSLLHFPWAHAPQVLPGALSCGARTFLHAAYRAAAAWPARAPSIPRQPADAFNVSA